MSKRRTSCLTLSLLALLAGACLSAAALAGAVFFLPQRAAQVFGPPAPGLGTNTRLLLAARLLLQEHDLTLPGDVYGSEQAFEVKLGETPMTVALRLEQEGLVSSADAFRNYLVWSGLDTTLQAGRYRLSPRMTAMELARALQDATPTEATLHVLPGWRMEEIAASLPTSGLSITPEEFLSAASRPGQEFPFLEDLPAGATLEGFLFPGAYTLSRQAEAGDLVQAMLQRFDAQATEEIRSGFQRQGLDLFQAVTLASLVEREAVSPDEMPLIASVFLNRFQDGIKLDSDPTVQYALGYNAQQSTWWTNPLSTRDLQVDSPYNTYLYGGLPPGPIANPGLEALRAVAFPARTPYFYFRAACDGSGRHVFSETYQQHLNNACP